MSAQPVLRPAASLRDALLGRAPWVGARLDPNGPAGFVSPVEARLHLGLAYGDLQHEEARALEQRSAMGTATTVARSLAARAVSRLVSRANEPPAQRPFVVSARVHAVTVADAVEKIVNVRPRGRAYVIHFVHAHALNLARSRPQLRAQLAKADLVLPDGIGLRLGAAINGAQLPHNVNGTDLLPLVCDAAARASVPIVLVGGAPGIASACAERLRASHPGLRIPYVSHGFLNADDRAKLHRDLRALGPCVVLVGMGTPVQEDFVWSHLADLPAANVVTVGGLFDFFSGRIARAPIAWRELGMEWVWRLLQEPGRLARRYLVGNPLFLALATAQRAGLLREDAPR